MSVENPNPRLTKYTLCLKRTDLKLLCSTLTGHGNFNKHLTTIVLRLTPYVISAWRRTKL